MSQAETLRARVEAMANARAALTRTCDALRGDWMDERTAEAAWAATVDLAEADKAIRRAEGRLRARRAELTSRGAYDASR